jgi:hypothetical protein
MQRPKRGILQRKIFERDTRAVKKLHEGRAQKLNASAASAARLRLILFV